METEATARLRRIDGALEGAGWIVQDYHAMNTRAGTGDVRGVAVREFPLGKYGFADYLLFVNGEAVGVVEAKRPGTSLLDAEAQAEKYSVGFPADLPARRRPLPFVYQSTGVETAFTNGFDPKPRARRVFHFHTPAGLLAKVDPPRMVNRRLRELPPLEADHLRACQVTATQNLERSFQEGRPRALIQMATGSGKTYMAITSMYRLLKHGGAKRVLFLVDRANLGRQAMKEFQSYVTPGDGRKFTELYNVHLLQNNNIPDSANVVLTTIQRLYSMLRGEAFQEEAEEASLFDHQPERPVEVEYKPEFPVELFDFVFIDECHRSIYNLWKQVVEYWDAYLVGLTATPDKQTFGFFRQNLVMEYNHERAVADHVNVDYDVYTIRTKVGTSGNVSLLEAGEYVATRDLKTRQERWEQVDENLPYTAKDLDRTIVNLDQIRTVIQTFRHKVRTELFPGRLLVPKTLIFAKSDAHADDIVRIVREEFGEDNRFCEKITYRTSTVRITETDEDGNEYTAYKSSGIKPEDLLQDFRVSPHLRIAVTVDMIATGTDVKPLEIVMFMRQVKSRNFFEQMKGRGVRVADDTLMHSVSSEPVTKDHFLLVDCCGLLDHEFKDTVPVNREPTIPLKKLFAKVAAGSRDTQVLSTLSSRLIRLDKRLGDEEKRGLQKMAGQSLNAVAAGLLRACDPDAWTEQARALYQVPEDEEPAPEQVEAAKKDLLEQAASPIAYTPDWRNAVLEMKSRSEQVIDHLTQDEVTEAGFDRDAKDRAQSIVASWEQFVVDHKDDITAIQVLYDESHGKPPRYTELKELQEQVKAAAPQCTPPTLWKAYEALYPERVKGSGGKIGDIVSLIRFALHHDELRPYRFQVEERFNAWIGDQEREGITYTETQMKWLTAIKDHIAESLSIEANDLEDPVFRTQLGGLGAYARAFGERAWPLLDELNEVLVT